MLASIISVLTTIGIMLSLVEGTLEFLRDIPLGPQADEEIHQGVLQLIDARDDLFVATRLVRAGGGQFEPIECALARQRLLAHLLLAAQQSQQRILLRWIASSRTW